MTSLLPLVYTLIQYTRPFDRSRPSQSSNSRPRGASLPAGRTRLRCAAGQSVCGSCSARNFPRSLLRNSIRRRRRRRRRPRPAVAREDRYVSGPEFIRYYIHSSAFCKRKAALWDAVLDSPVLLAVSAQVGRTAVTHC